MRKEEVRDIGKDPKNNMKKKKIKKIKMFGDPSGLRGVMKNAGGFGCKRAR